MREILFRGKRTDNGEWVEGFYLYTKDNTHPVIIDMKCCSHIIDPKTVGQFTGLTDKNGKRIFEGDIVTGWFNHEKIVGYIFYGGNARFFIQRDRIYGIGLDNASNWLEVIGNIHDNPELTE